MPVGFFLRSVDKFFRGTPPVYDERQENKAVNCQALWSYWLEEGQPGQLRIFPPQGMTEAHPVA